MKKSTLLNIVIVCLVIGLSFYFFGEDGALQSKGQFEEGKKQGKWKHYAATGWKYEVKMFEKGKRILPHFTYFENGQLNSKKTIDSLQTWYESSVLNSVLLRRNGEDKGKCVQYWPNGVKAREFFESQRNRNLDYDDYWDTTGVKINRYKFSQLRWELELTEWLPDYN